jgi:signal transduction histidine kinase
MFSETKAIQATSSGFEGINILEKVLKKFIETRQFKACLICHWLDRESPIELITTIGFTDTPFYVNKRQSIDEFIRMCLSQHPAPHYHKVKGTNLWNEISSVTSTSDWNHRALFLPAVSKGNKYIMLLFLENSQVPKLDTILLSECNELFREIDLILGFSDLSERMRIMEIFVREVGHDIASSVQSIISKTSLIKRKIVTGEAVIKRAEEIENEILSTYRVAENLGITVDPDYNIQSTSEFDVEDIVTSVITQCRSEAEERHIELRKDSHNTDKIIWGDKKALQNALMHYLLNAIKYAKGSTYITLGTEDDKHYTTFTVTNVGKTIPKDDQSKIWTFGWRGKNAKEQHVNGSGIGLYTVKKIITAHGGNVGVKASPGITSDFGTTVFNFQIPKDFDQQLLHVAK